MKFNQFDSVFLKNDINSWIKKGTKGVIIENNNTMYLVDFTNEDDFIIGNEEGMVFLSVHEEDIEPSNE